VNNPAIQAAWSAADAVWDHAALTGENDPELLWFRAWMGGYHAAMSHGAIPAVAEIYAQRAADGNLDDAEDADPAGCLVWDAAGTIRDGRITIVTRRDGQ
jgi:hypothetical protein